MEPHLRVVEGYLDGDFERAMFSDEEWGYSKPRVLPVDRILNPRNPSITLQTLGKAAHALGKRWKFDLVEA